MIGKYTWEFDKDEEFWRNATFDTIEECIQEAKKVMQAYGEEHSVIYIGETEVFEPYVFGTDVMERIEEQAFEECGEAAEGWGIWNEIRSKGEAESKAAWEELSDKLTEAVNHWLKKYNLVPNFYKIVNIREVPVDGAIQPQKE